MPDRLDPTFVRAHIEALRHTHPQIANEEDQWLLTLESETELHEFLARVVARMQDTDAKIDGIGNLIATLKARCDRFEQRSDAMRALAFKVLVQAGVKKLELVAATLSIRAGVPRVIIIDEARLPEQFVRIKREPDKHLIASHLKAGEPVEGAALSNSEPVLSVRVK
jgi:beta-phosphoglucomutase-like phosphatase (HAD superfamily)